MPGIDVVVGRVGPDALAAAGELTAAAYAADGFVGVDYLETLRDAASRDRDAEVWVATDAIGTLLGCVTFCPPGSVLREIAIDDSEGEFRMLAVAPAARRRGIARLLVEHCLDRSRQLGQTRLVLCSERRMSAAHRLYASLGFTRLPDRDWAPVPGVDLLGYAVELA